MMEMAVSRATAMVRKIELTDLRWALQQGWDDFKTHRGDIIVLVIIYPVATMLAAFFALNADLFALIFPVVGGFALLGPAVAAGFYELARRREAGLEAGWGHFLAPVTGRAGLPLAVLTLMLVAIFLAWLVAAQAIFDATVGRLTPATPAEFGAALIGTSEGLSMIVVGNLVGAGFAVVTLALAAFSFPMVVDTGCGPLTALKTSLSAFRRSPVTMMAWGVAVAVILALAALPLLIGLVVALPVLGYATWHLYTRAVVR